MKVLDAGVVERIVVKQIGIIGILPAVIAAIDLSSLQSVFQCLLVGLLPEVAATDCSQSIRIEGILCSILLLHKVQHLIEGR